MNCSALESLIALFVEGDLSASDRQRVDMHLQGCKSCRDLAEDLRESQSMFSRFRARTVNSSDLAGVRERVLSKVGDINPAPGWVVAMHRLFFAGLYRRNAIAGVLLAALISGGVWYSQTREVVDRKIEPPIDVARFDAPEAFDLPGAQPSGDVPRVAKHVEPRKVMDVVEVLPVEPAPVESPVQTSGETTSPEAQVSQIAMKFVTDDPDIIIYWLPNDKGD